MCIYIYMHIYISMYIDRYIKDGEAAVDFVTWFQNLQFDVRRGASNHQADTEDLLQGPWRFHCRGPFDEDL